MSHCHFSPFLFHVFISYLAFLMDLTRLWSNCRVQSMFKMHAPCSSTWICMHLLRTCKRSQASTAGHPGMHNLMPKAHNKLHTKESKMTMHLPYGSYTAVHVLLLAMFSSAKRPRPFPVSLVWQCFQSNSLRKCGIRIADLPNVFHCSIRQLI